MSDVATNCMQAVIGVVKQAPDITRPEVEAVIENFYPGQADWRLDLYIEALYKVGTIENQDFYDLRFYIAHVPVEKLSLIMPQVRIVADELLKPYLEQAALQARKAELETLLAGSSPIKTEPDQEAMEFWNMMSIEALDWQAMQVEYQQLCDRLEG